MSPRSNVRRLRPSEWRAVLALLEQDHDDVELLAKDIVRTINRLRAVEPVWVRVVEHGSGAVLYGPYNSAEEARTDDQSWGPSKVRGRMFTASLVAPFGQPMDELDDAERQ